MAYSNTSSDCLLQLRVPDLFLFYSLTYQFNPYWVVPLENWYLSQKPAIDILIYLKNSNLFNVSNFDDPQFRHLLKYSSFKRRQLANKYIQYSPWQLKIWTSFPIIYVFLFQSFLSWIDRLMDPFCRCYLFNFRLIEFGCVRSWTFLHSSNQFLYFFRNTKACELWIPAQYINTKRQSFVLIGKVDKDIA